MVQNLLRVFAFAEIVFLSLGYHFEKCELAKIFLHKHKLPQNQINDCKFFNVTEVYKLKLNKFKKLQNICSTEICLFDR
jgi:hypothetical protein